MRNLCPICGEDFDQEILRCTCGFEGEPIFTEKSAFLKEFNKVQITEDTNDSIFYHSEIQEKYLLAEEILRNAEAEFNKARHEKAIALRLKEKLQEEINHYQNLKNENQNDSYLMLGLHCSDSFQIVKKTYRSLVALYHPDKHNSSSEESKKQKSNQLSKINEAYEKIAKEHG